MNKNMKGLLVVVGVLGVAAGAYFLVINNIRRYATEIVRRRPGTSYDTLVQLDKEYVKAWAKALMNDQESFTLNGQTFNGKTGRKTG